MAAGLPQPLDAVTVLLLFKFLGHLLFLLTSGGKMWEVSMSTYPGKFLRELQLPGAAASVLTEISFYFSYTKINAF